MNSVRGTPHIFASLKAMDEHGIGWGFIIIQTSRQNAGTLAKPSLKVTNLAEYVSLSRSTVM